MLLIKRIDNITITVLVYGKLTGLVYDLINDTWLDYDSHQTIHVHQFQNLVFWIFGITLTLDI